MRPTPSNMLNPKVCTSWRIAAALWVVPTILCTLAIFAIIALAGEVVPGIAWAILGILSLALIVLFVGVIPSIRYRRWRYEVGENELDIMKGIWWRYRYVIPFVRVQSTDTKQGPVLRMLGLASVTVSTAAQNHEIPGLLLEEADALRDAIAVQARLAQEDV